MRAETAAIAQAPMQIRVLVVEALAKPVVVAEVLRQAKRVLVAVVAVRHYIPGHL